MTRTVLNDKGESMVHEALRPQEALQAIIDELESALEGYRLAYPEAVYPIERWQNDDLPKRRGKPLGEVMDHLMDMVGSAIDIMPDLDAEREKVTERLLCEDEFCENLSSDEM